MPAEIRRLLVLNMMTDADDPILGFTTAWINALAERCGCVDVITMIAGRLEVAANVRVFSLGKERGYSEPRRAVEFYRVLGWLLSQDHYDAAFAHMTPLFAVMGAPLFRLHRVPVTLWYAHSQVSLTLRLAELAADHAVSASPESFRLPSRKLIIMGHGIDTEEFRPAERLDPLLSYGHSPPQAGEEQDERQASSLEAASNKQPTDQPIFTVGTVGRIGPKKQTALLVEAARILAEDGVDFRARIVGAPLPGDEGYVEGLKEEAQRLGLGNKVLFTGPVRFERVVEEYQALDAMVNMSLTGAIDKAVLEAMACGVPAVTSNEAFFPILEPWKDLLIVADGSARTLAERLKALIGMGQAERAALGEKLRQIVVEQHSLDRLMDRLVALWVGERRR